MTNCDCERSEAMSAKRLLRNPDRSQTCSPHIWIATSHIREPRDDEVLGESRDDKSKKLTLSLESAFSYFYRFATVSLAPCWQPLSSFLAVATFR